MRPREIALASWLVAGACGCQPTDRLPSTGAPDPNPPVLDAAAEAPTIDGWFEDWSEAARLTEDPPGDADGAFDVTHVYAVGMGSKVYVRFDTTALRNLYNGAPTDGTIIAAVRLPDGRVLRVDFRGRSALVNGLVAVTWQALDLVAAPNHASREFELRMDLEGFDVGAGSRIELWLEGSDTTEPVALELTDSPTPDPVAEIPSPVAGGFRVASLNTHEQGLADPARFDEIGRLLRAAAADVYMLQELGTLTDVQIGSRVAAAFGEDTPWNTCGVSYGDFVKSAVVSRSPLVPIDTAPARFAGAIVLTDDGPIAAFSVHLKCCGFFGSAEDDQRLAEGEQLRATIADLRAGALGDDLAAYAAAPVVVMGDFNDVGSPDLQLLLTLDAPALERLPLRHLRGPDVFTWRSTIENFPPAVLDLAFFGGVKAAGGFVLDSRTLAPNELDALGLKLTDSLGSDHLVLVADFAPVDP